MRRGDDPECAFDLGTGGERVRIDIGHENAFVAFGHGAYRCSLLRVIKHALKQVMWGVDFIRLDARVLVERI
jgi:hypothetical protein